MNRVHLNADRPVYDKLDIGSLVQLGIDRCIFIVAQHAGKLPSGGYGTLVSLINLDSGNRWSDAVAWNCDDNWKDAIRKLIVDANGRILEPGEQVTITVA